MSSDERRHYRICPLCEACCGLEVRTHDGRVTGIRGADNDVFSRGYICPKGYALKDLHEDPDRLRQPLIRRNGRHEPASWDEAFAEIHRRLTPILQSHGRDAVAVTVGNPAAHRFGLLLYFARLARALGTRNIYSASTLDQMPKQLSSGLMFGHWLSVAVPDIARCDHLVILGANPAVSNGSLWTVPDFRGKAKALRARGGRIVTIDPRRHETAAAADTHHFIRPGTDAALLAAMAHTLFDEGLVRLGRLQPWVNGLEEVKAAVAPFTPERVAATCGVEAGTIRQLARDLAQAKAGCLYGRLGTCTQRFGSVASWLVDVINVLIGQLDAPGGAMFPKAPAFAANTQGPAGVGRGVVTGRHAGRVSGAPEVYGELPITCLPEEIETPGPGQVRALITAGSNPVLSAPGGERLARALGSLELMVSIDIYLNETTQHADVILPALSALEETHYDVAFPQFSDRNHARYSGRVFEPAVDHPPEWRTLLRLTALAMGRGPDADLDALDDELFEAETRRLPGAGSADIASVLAPLRGPERLLDLALRTGPYGAGFGPTPAHPEALTLARLQATPGGIDLGPLQSRVPEVLRTPSGKIELAPPTLLADLAQVQPSLDQPVPPLVIIGRREVRSNNSWMHNLPTLAKGPDRCTLQIHPTDAAARSLTEGAQVEIRGPAGQVHARVTLTDALMPGVVSLPHGWGHNQPGAQLQVAAQRPGANLNAVLDDRLRDPLSGNAVLSGVAVEVVAVPA